ncbi:MAG: helix-turn-helix transcriptional regulator, partial [Christensenellaceae bacterium]|nr:helix-turn-helix transcriptional regulator [Christensenellaceae bacterium]
MDYRSLGMRIRKQRKNLHLTQEELAERAGISLSFLGHIERGTRKASLETLVSLSN